MSIAFRFTRNGIASVGIGDGGSRKGLYFKCKRQCAITVFGSCILSPNSTSALTYRLQIEAESEGMIHLGENTNDNNDRVYHILERYYLHVIELLK